jgi:hypothetical protein
MVWRPCFCESKAILKNKNQKNLIFCSCLYTTKFFFKSF